MKNKINWIAKEYIGTEVTDSQTKLPFTNLIDMFPRRVVHGWFAMEIENINIHEQTATARTLDGTCLCMLEFNKDDRHCWVHSETINIKALENLNGTI
jgi:hypothetical protein